MSNKLFVGGLLPSVTDEVLRQHFDKYGPISEAIVLRDRGFGFVTFEDASSASAALAGQHDIDGRPVSVKEAVGKSLGKASSDSLATSSSGSKDNRVTDKVFVGGLPQDCADDKIRDYFAAYGTIVDAVVMKDRDTGRSRGFGFVQFDDTHAVDKVMAEYKEHKIEGKWVEVKRSVPRDQMAAMSSPPSRSAPPSAYGGSHGYDMTPPPHYGGCAYGSPYGPPPGYGYPAYPPAYGYPGGYPSAYPGVPSSYGAYGAPPPASGGYPGYATYGSPPLANGPGSRDSRSRPY